MPKTAIRKLPKPERRAQLIETSKEILRECGADALTLGHLAERAGVSKPIAYEHFGTRERLLIALSREIEERHTQKLKRALLQTPQDLALIADTIGSVYIDCAAENGSEWQAMSSALRGNAEMDRVQQELADDYVALIGAAVAPYSRLADGDLRLRCAGIAGAAETIAREFVRGRATQRDAAANLAALIVNGVST